MRMKEKKAFLPPSPFFRSLTTWVIAYIVAEGVGSDGIFSCQRDAAKNDEDKDEIGEDVMVDQLVAPNTKASGRREGSKLIT